MKLVVLALFFTLSVADKLQNSYIPPPANARSAGGSDFLTAPSKTSKSFTAYRKQGPLNSLARSSLNSHTIPNKSNAIFRNSESIGEPIPILRMSNDNNGDGSYRYAYETENRIIQEEEGHLENIGTDHEANVVHGAYSFQAPDGQVFTVNYIADENGFRAIGDHLPTSPPIPDAIQKSLETNRAAESFNDETDSLSRSSNYGRYNYNKPSQRSFDNNVASSEDSDDLAGIEILKPDIDVNRQYLPPNFRNSGNGYRY